MLVRDGISTVPVVEGGELVGILSEADLVPLELAPDPRAHLIPPADAPVRLPNVVAEAMTREVPGLVAIRSQARPAGAGGSRQTARRRWDQRPWRGARCSATVPGQRQRRHP